MKLRTIIFGPAVFLIVFGIMLAIEQSRADTFQVAPYGTNTTRTTWPYGTAPVGAECDAAVIAQSATGKVKYHWIKGQLPPTGKAAPCVLVVSPTPIPTPTPTPTPTPVPPPVASCPAQTTDGIVAAKKVTICFTNPRTGASLTHDVIGTRVRFMTPTGCGSGCDGTPTKPYAPQQIFADSKPGDVNVFRAGTYDRNYGGGWGNRNFALGSAQSWIALVGMPGEVAKFVFSENITLANGPSVQRPAPVCQTIDNVQTCTQADNPTPNAAHNVTIAGLTLVGGGSSIDTGGYWESEESGARNAVIVANDITATYTGNTMTGVVTIQGDGARVLGNRFHDFGTTPPINNNHGLYLQTGPDNVEVAYNRFENLKLGHVIQFHNDGTKRLVENGWVHDNLLKGANSADMRGFNAGDIGATSTILVENNDLDNLGQDFSAVAVYCGNIKLYNNRFTNIFANPSVWLQSAGAPCNPAPTIREKGNTGATFGTIGVPVTNIIHE
jgi:hypothetical protein